jgi:sarcosine oxidase
MPTRVVPNLVIGGGAIGTAAAYHLSQRGEPVLLVDQFAFGHDRGSSHGAARIIRHSYADPSYARLMIDAFDAWRALEADAGRVFFRRTGGVSICPQSIDYVAKVEASLKSIGVPHRRMPGSDWNRCSPGFAISASDHVVFEPDAGLLAAAEAMEAERALAIHHGAEFRQEAKVRKLDLDSSRPTLIFDDDRIEAERLIVAAGPWTNQLLPSLPVSLVPTRQQVIYFRPEAPAFSESGRMPVFISMGERPGQAYYGMPACLGMGIKVARHGGPETSPDVTDREVSAGYIAEIRAFLRETIPLLADAPIDRTETCLYTMADKEEFRIGRLPMRREVIVASTCSGHGFKFSTLIGRILADLCQSDPELDSSAVHPWRLI